MEALAGLFSGTGAAAAGTGVTEAGLGSGAIGTGLTAGELAAAPVIEGITFPAAASSFLPGVIGALDTGGKVIGGVNAVKSALTPAADKAPSSAPSTPATAPSTISPEDYTNSERARYQQLFAGTGQGLPGGALPDDIQQMIQRNASLLR